MGFRLELPQYHTADERLREIYAYLTRMVEQLNYALGFLDVPAASASAGTAAAEDAANKSAAISERSTNVQYPTSRAVYNYAVPQTREVNGYALSEDITLIPDDLGAVPAQRSINGHSLTDDITLIPSDLGAVPQTRKVNGHSLTDDITLTPPDLGVPDYVTQTGENENGWRWRRWRSGIVELWGETISISLSSDSTWTGDWRYKTGTITFPFSFGNTAYAVLLNLSRQGTGRNAVVGAIRKESADRCSFVVMAPSAVLPSALQADVYVMGKEVTA